MARYDLKFKDHKFPWLLVRTGRAADRCSCGVPLAELGQRGQATREASLYDQNPLRADWSRLPPLGQNGLKLMQFLVRNYPNSPTQIDPCKPVIAELLVDLLHNKIELVFRFAERPTQRFA